MSTEKKYGLLVPKKQQLSAPKAGNIFGDSDDSDNDDGPAQVKKALKAQHEKNKVKKQTLIDMQKALDKDPTIFQYDEVYDDMERTKKEEQSSVKVDKNPKYIFNLLKTAELRKQEQELRKDRMIQKEIEAEDNLFPDKERFVTSSYKTKLEEMKKFAEEQENQNRLEAICDVTKQSDMSGFYRHLYRQTVEKKETGTANVLEENDTESKKERKEKEKANVKLPADIDKDDPVSSESDSDSSSGSKEKEEAPKLTSITKSKKKRQYRKRDVSKSESDEEPAESKIPDTALGRENSASDQSSGESETPLKKPKLNANDIEKKKEKSESAADESEKENKDSTKETSTETEKQGEVPKAEKPKPVKKERNLSIWKKRTVGPVYEAALQRYLHRKAERLAGS